MTPEEIRREYVEVLARAYYEKVSVIPPRWDDTDLGMPAVRDKYRCAVAYLVDALADVGLLPTSVEGRYIGRGHLRRTRLVTDWKEPEQ